MIYNVYITGQFLGIETVTAVQTFPLSLRCYNCKKEFDKYVCISYKSKENLFIYSCSFCKNDIKLSINLPNLIPTKCIDPITKRQSIKPINPFRDISHKKIQITQIIGTNFELINIPRVEFSVLSNQHYLYEDVPIEDNSWSSTNPDDSNVFIDCFDICFELANENELCNLQTYL